MKQLKDEAIVAHVHDEVIIEADLDQTVSSISKQMAIAPPWMPDINLRANGYECFFYQKD